MHPFIKDTFWSDLDFERFDGAELVGHRLSFLWALTSPVRNDAGIFPENRRTFTGETGLPFDQLEKTMIAFPKSFHRDPESKHVLITRFIHHQFGSGPALSRNTMAFSVFKALNTSPPALISDVFRRYPELCEHKGYRSPAIALPKPYPSPTPTSVPQGTSNESHSPAIALPEGYGRTGKGREGKGREGKDPLGDARGDSTVATPSVEEVVTWGQMDGVPEACCRDFWAWHDSRDWMSGNTHIRRPRGLLKSYAYGWQERQNRSKSGSGYKNAGGAPSGPTRDDVEAALQSERDPAKRAALEKQLAALA